MKKICIVISALATPANHHEADKIFGDLAARLAEKYAVTILYAGPMSRKSWNHWSKFRNQRQQIVFEHLDLSKLKFLDDNRYLGISLNVYNWLKNKEFNIVYFQRQSACGFHCLQARRTLGAFRGTLLTVGQPSNAQEAEDCPGRNSPWASVKLAWMKRYCHHHCDVLLAEPQDLFSLELEQPPQLPMPSTATSLVSICIPYYNHGKYLEQALSAIKTSEYQNYEVLVINDGSDDAGSIKVFQTMRDKYKQDGNWHFYEQPNLGNGAARNQAAEFAKGEFLIFMDSDNCPHPNMIATMAGTIEYSRLDCLACHYLAFTGDAPPGEDTVASYCYAPYGACLEGGLSGNVFGDTNFIIKTSVFKALGGFETNRWAWEDYEFLARLCLKGYHFDVVPESLLWYRHSSRSFGRTTKNLANHIKIAEHYAQGLPDHMQFMIKEFIIPLCRKHDRYDSTVWNILFRLLPPHSRRGRLASSIYQAIKRCSLR